MRYCPTCKQGFEDQSECPVDRTALVDELPFQTIAGDGETTWVEIASCGGEDEARLLQGFLQAEGIDAQIENVKFSMEPINFGTMGDIRIYVAATNEAHARELLNERDRAFDKLDVDGETLVTDDGPADIGEGEMAPSEGE
jgi:hypothetical protein